MVKECRVDNCITVHAWNADRSLLALCPNNNQVHIYKRPEGPDSPWDKIATLKEHDALITSIAWAPETNRIVTTSQDRNAYVWTLTGKEWKPMLVILRITAAATSAEWSPQEAKFAVGSGSKTVPVCYYEEGNNFWVSKMLKGNASTVLGVAWHPTSPLLATASTDFKCRIFSAWLKKLDGKQETPFGKDPKFGTILFETPSYGWVLNVAFNPTGDTLVFASHDSTVTFVDVAAAAAEQGCMQALRLSELPITQLLFLPDGSLVGGGHCYDPLLFTNTAQGWTLAGKVVPHASSGGAKKSAMAATRDMWKAQVNTGEGGGGGVTLESAHHNQVCGMQLFGTSFGGTDAVFTTSGLDGKVIFWSEAEIKDAMAGGR